jgi:hypothetical protein
MLPFLCRRSVHSPLCLPHVHRRSLSTLPRPILPYLRVWNPTNHTRFSGSEPPFEPNIAALEERKIKCKIKRKSRKRLRDTEGVSIVRPSREAQTPAQTYHLKQLNRLLRVADSGEGEKEHLGTQIWIAYCRAKKHVPRLLTRIPDRGWDVLWATQTFPRLQTRTQVANAATLRNDMYAIGRSTTVGQEITYLEKLLLEGRKKEALTQWKMEYAGVAHGSRHDYKAEHLEMGAKLYAMVGNADRALEIMEELFDLYPTWDPSVMMHVFRVHTDTDTDQHRKEAWKIYSTMRDMIREHVTREHYDAWLVGFLEAKHTNYAKLVFRDMIKGGFIGAYSSTQDVEETLRRFHLLSRLGTDIENMTSICLRAISSLPPAYHLHVFGCWMKTAVRESAADVAFHILDTAFNRGYRLGTSHFNLFLRVLLRTKEKPRITMAENIGWRMIDERRIARKKKARIPSSIDGISIHAEGEDPYAEIVDPVLDSEAAKKVPQANVTTFALVMQHHADAGQWEHVDYLVRRLKEDNLPLDSTLLNVLMNIACQKGEFSETWKIYKSLTDVPDGLHRVFPDGASIRCLWKTLRLALGTEEARHDPDLPTPRQLLAETVEWWKLCRSRHDANEFHTGLVADSKTALTKLVMHCFSYTQDLAGSLVALHVMRQQLHIFPTEEVPQIVRNQAAWVSMHHESESVRLQYDLNKIKQNNSAKLDQVYHILLKKRLERLGHTWEEQQYPSMNTAEIGDAGLNLLSEFIRVIMKRSYEPQTVEAVIQEAKNEVGVPNMRTGDMDAFEVA